MSDKEFGPSLESRHNAIDDLLAAYHRLTEDEQVFVLKELMPEALWREVEDELSDDLREACDTAAKRQFVLDMLENDIVPYLYHGKFYYRGPAIDADAENLRLAMSLTTVRLKRDDMGRGYVLYPA
jgi:hypothetical protein